MHVSKVLSLPSMGDLGASPCLETQPMERKTRMFRNVTRAANIVWAKTLVLFVLSGCLLWDKYHKSIDILDIAPLIDGHNDFPIWIRAFYQNHIYQRNFTQESKLYGQVDFPRLRQGRLGGQFWSVYVECPKHSFHHSERTSHEIVHDTLQQIDLVYRLIKAYPSYLQHAYKAADIRRTFKAGSQIASLMGIEGLHQIGGSASILRVYHSLGVRYTTLTHTCHNAYADSEEPINPLHGGLSDSGKALVREMNRLGMIIDLSHTSFDTQRDTIAITKAPVIFSHSNAYQLCNHTRNVPNEILEMLMENDGVIMVTFYASFLEDNPINASLNSVANHVQYIGETIGYRHVGLGSDFDGMAAGPEGVEDVTKYPDIIKELQRRQIRKADILGIMGLNILRVLEKVEEVSESLNTVLPLEDEVRPFFDI